MPYPFREGLEKERLELIWSIYQWTGSASSGTLYGWTQMNKNRENPIAWDLCQIFAAIAGGYVIELSPHYKGVQYIRKNKALWDKVSKFVKLKTGQACLPYDTDGLGEKWEKMNGVNFFVNENIG